MRHILTILLLLSAIALTGQTWPKDSTWNAQESGTWFSYKQTLYENGSLTLEKTYIGTDSTLAATKTTNTRQRSATWANDARAVAKIRKEITETLRLRDVTRTQIGIDFLKAIQDQVAPTLTAGTWELRTDTTRAITFSVNAQGVLRYTVSGYQARQAHVLGEAMRLDRFLNSKDPTDLFRDGDVWRNLSGSVVMRPAGSNERSAARASLEPPTGGVVSEKLVEEATVITNPMVMQEAPAKTKTTKKKTTKKK